MSTGKPWTAHWCQEFPLLLCFEFMCYSFAMCLCSGLRPIASLVCLPNVFTCPEFSPWLFGLFMPCCFPSSSQNLICCVLRVHFWDFFNSCLLLFYLGIVYRPVLNLNFELPCNKAHTEYMHLHSASNCMLQEAECKRWMHVKHSSISFHTLPSSAQKS